MGERALAFLQAGLEGTKGTATNATRILMARMTSANFERPREFPEEDRGTLVAASRFYDGVKDYGFTIECDGVNYEQLGYFFANAVKGSVSPTTINTAAYRFTYTPQTTATGDDLQASTIEFGDDTQEYESTYCEVNSFTLGFDTLKVGDAAPVQAKFEYVAKSLASNTKTAALSVPTVETILATNAAFYIGSTSTAFASLSALTGSLRAFELKYDNNLGRKVFVGGTDTYSDIGRGRRVVTFTATVEGNSDGVTRFVEWDLGTEKRARLLFQGSVISGASPATTKKLQIDFHFVLTKFDPIGSVDTNTVYMLEGRCLPDSALSDAEIQFVLTNGSETAAYT